ncbi:hypothetical protein GQ53DRAFT_437982 [Thozetella sp. PMI_491]|nr:hypothetical protein GQ53DRAFT_437982 [Thozetella sp. PMI_491]
MFRTHTPVVSLSGVSRAGGRRSLSHLGAPISPWTAPSETHGGRQQIPHANANPRPNQGQGQHPERAHGQDACGHGRVPPANSRTSFPHRAQQEDPAPGDRLDATRSGSAMAYAGVWPSKQGFQGRVRQWSPCLGQLPF